MQWRIKPTRIGHLRDQADIGKIGFVTAEQAGFRRHGFQRSKSFSDPVAIPGVDDILLLSQFILEIFQDPQIVHRMDVRRDDHGLGECGRSLERITGHHRRLGIFGI